MHHSFDVSFATEYGLNSAIIFENIMYWCIHNEANNTHKHDGTYWTYNSIRAFNILFPYMTERQIRTALSKLEENGLIATGNYNADRRDRTGWYAVTEKGKCIYQKCQMQIAEMSNANCGNVKPLPDINYNYKQTLKEDQEERAREESQEEPKHEDNPYGGKLDIPAVDNDTARVCKAYQTQIGQIPGGKAWELLCSYIEDIGADAVIVAIEETNLAQPSGKWNYLKRILDSFAEKGIKDADAARGAINDHKTSVNASKQSGVKTAAESKPKFNYQQHTYTDADFDYLFDDPAEYFKDKDKWLSERHIERRHESVSS